MVLGVNKVEPFSVTYIVIFFKFTQKNHIFCYYFVIIWYISASFELSWVELSIWGVLMEARPMGGLLSSRNILENRIMNNAHRLEMNILDKNILWLGECPLGTIKVIVPTLKYICFFQMYSITRVEKCALPAEIVDKKESKI